MGVNIDLQKVMAGKSDEELQEISVKYKKYTKEALIVFLNEVKKRGVAIENALEIEARVKELEIEEKKKFRVIEEKDLHPNIIRASKLLLLEIPVGIVQLLFSAYYIYQNTDQTFDEVLLRVFSASFVFICLISYLFSVWIKKGTTTARQVIGVLTGISVVSKIYTLITLQFTGVLNAIIIIIYLLIESYILYLLFNKASSKWYAR
jgi:hypothetical protein